MKVFKTALLSCIVLLSLLSSDVRVLIFPLENLNENVNFNYLRDTIPQSLSTVLKESGKFELNSTDVLSNEMAKREMSDLYNVSYDDAVSIAREAEIDVIIKGNIVVLSGQIQINLEAIDAELGMIKIAESVQGDSGIELFDLIDEISARMKDKMIEDLPDQEMDVKEKKKRSIETQYENSSRRGWSFYSVSGISFFSARWAEFDTYSHFSGISTFGFGFGYKRISLDIVGTPPILEFNEKLDEQMMWQIGDDGGVSQIDFNLKINILPDRLIVSGRASMAFGSGYVVTYNTNNDPPENYEKFDYNVFCPMLGAKLTLFKRLHLDAHFGVSIPGPTRFRKDVWGDSQYERDVKTDATGFKLSSGMEFIFFRGFGLRLQFDFIRMSSKSELYIKSADDIAAAVHNMEIGHVNLNAYGLGIDLVYNVKF